MNIITPIVLCILLLLFGFLKNLFLNYVISKFSYHKLNCHSSYSTIKTSLLNLFSDLIGFAALVIYGAVILAQSFRGDNIILPLIASVDTFLCYPDFSKTDTILFILVGILISAVLSFLFTVFISLHNIRTTKRNKIVIAFLNAILCAPYYFLFPFSSAFLGIII